MSLRQPPILPTDLPTNEQYLTGVGFQAGSPNIGTTDHALDNIHPYNNTVGDGFSVRAFGPNTFVSTVSIAHLPNGFNASDYQRGLAMLYRTQDHQWFGGPVLHLGLHPAANKVEDYAQGWKVVPDIMLTHGSGNFGEGSATGILAAQRQGEYLYAFLYSAIEDVVTLQIKKIRRGEYVQTLYDTSLFLSDFELPLDASDPNNQFFISDDYVPFVWHVRGTQQSGADKTAQSAYVTGFLDDGTPLGSMAAKQDNGLFLGGGIVLTGKVGAHYQKYHWPVAGIGGYGPVLVHPWASGRYAAPELWFFVHEIDARGFFSGRLKIYRSRWGANEYIRYDNPSPGPLPFAQQSIELSDDPAYKAGALFPALNPNGYAFEFNWYDDAHLVGTVGPFPNANFFNRFNTGQNALAPLYNPVATIQSIRVVRDRQRRGVLHLVLFAAGASPLPNQHPQVDDPTVINSIWFATSLDDGRTWLGANQISPPLHGFNQGTEGANPVATTGMLPLSVERLYQGYTAVNCGWAYADTHNAHDSGGRAAMALVDYGATGVGQPDKHNVVFRQGEINRQSWL